MIDQAEIHAALRWAMSESYGQEVAKLKMQLVTYRALLEQNGITPPDDSGADLLQMWRDCQELLRAAQNLVANLGTSKEMLSERWK